MVLFVRGCGETAVCGVIVTVGCGGVALGGSFCVLARFETTTNPPSVSSEITNTIAVAFFVNVLPLKLLRRNL